MAKVQFNCRLREDTIRAINKNAAQMSAAQGRKVSQAEVIERAFDGELIASTHGGLSKFTPKIETKIAANFRPRKQSKRAKVVAEETPRGQHVANMGKEFKPLLKPKDRK